MTNFVGNQRQLHALAAWARGKRFPHTVMIEGAQGTGRKTLAKELAKAVLCSGDPRPCSVCSHCIKVERSIHPDFLSVSGAGGANSFHLEAVRAVRSEAYVKPNEAKSKVFLLLNAEEMTIQAQNALLKIIEEPPSFVHFILICENRKQLLPTVQSRAVLLTMQVPSVEDCAQELRRLAPEHTAQKHLFAAVQAQGNIGKALILLNDESAMARLQVAKSIYEHLIQGRELEALSQMEDCQRDKPLFLERIAQLTSIAIEEFKSPTSHRVSLLQSSQIVDILEELQEATARNTNLLLLCTLLCSKIREVLEK